MSRLNSPSPTGALKVAVSGLCEGRVIGREIWLRGVLGPKTPPHKQPSFQTLDRPLQLSLAAHILLAPTLRSAWALLAWRHNLRRKQLHVLIHFVLPPEFRKCLLNLDSFLKNLMFLYQWWSIFHVKDTICRPPHLETCCSRDLPQKQRFELNLRIKLN